MYWFLHSYIQDELTPKQECVATCGWDSVYYLREDWSASCSKIDDINAQSKYLVLEWCVVLMTAVPCGSQRAEPTSSSIFPERAADSTSCASYFVSGLPCMVSTLGILNHLNKSDMAGLHYENDWFSTHTISAPRISFQCSGITSASSGCRASKVPIHQTTQQASTSSRHYLLNKLSTYSTGEWQPSSWTSFHSWRKIFLR